MKCVGRVYLVGAGPGDPGLITVRGRQLLERADVVIYDRLTAPALLTCCQPGARRIDAGKEAGRHTLSQARINQLMVREARAGRTVVRLKGGDPFLFGRGGEEALALRRSGVTYEVVPGVTSALAAPAYAGIPVTHREFSSSVAIVTGHEDPDKPGSAVRWGALGQACDTIVWLMGVAALPAIVRQLIRGGRSPGTPCAAIAWGTWPRQRVITGRLGTIVRQTRRAKLKPPAVFVAGRVVSLRRRLRWCEQRPLFGQRIIVTRAAEKAGVLAQALEGLGAEVEQLPAIELAPVSPNGVFTEAIRELPRTDWVFFTSPEGIGWFGRMLKPYRKDLRALAGCRIAAIGPKTAAAVEDAGLHVDFLPRRFSQEGLLADLPSRLTRGKRALILSAETSRDVLEEGLRKRGARVRKVAIYRTVIPPALVVGVREALRRPVDLVTVTSASCAQHFYRALALGGQYRAFRRLAVASIGPVTSQAVRRLGGRVAVEAKVSTVEGLIEAITRWAR